MRPTLQLLLVILAVVQTSIATQRMHCLCNGRDETINACGQLQKEHSDIFYDPKTYEACIVPPHAVEALNRAKVNWHNWWTRPCKSASSTCFSVNYKP